MSNLKTVKTFLESNPSFTNGGIRALIFNAESNGLSQFKAIIRIGRKVLIDENAFFEWVKAQNEGEIK